MNRQNLTNFNSQSVTSNQNNLNCFDSASWNNTNNILQQINNPGGT